MSAHKYLVLAGCSDEGHVLSEQPYSGPIDAESLAAFALDMLRQSPYARSATAWGLQELDWVDAENYGEAAEPVFMVYDYDNACTDEPACEDGNCECETPNYWVAVNLA